MNSRTCNRWDRCNRCNSIIPITSFNLINLFNPINPFASPFSLAFVLLLATASAHAANYSLQISDITWTGSPGGYDCFSATAYPNTVNFTITKTANGRKDFAVTAGASANTGSYTRQLRSGSSVLNYQLYTSSAMTYVWEEPPAAIANDVFSGTLSGQSGQVVPLSATFFVPPGQVVPPGTYSDQVAISIYDAYDSVGSPQTTRTINIRVVVTPSVAISIVPSGGGFNSGRPQYTLDFGTLTTGEQQSCDVLVKQNSNCTLLYSSDNAGVLKQFPTATVDKIAYTCTFSGATLDLSQSASLPLPSGVSAGPDGSRFPINITIGDISDAAAGFYQDQITLTVQAQ